MRLILALACAGLLAACASDGSGPTRPSGGNSYEARMDGQFFYNCTNGDRVEVIFFREQGIAVLNRGGERMELNRRATRSGFIYTQGETSIQGSGYTMQIFVPGFPPLTCTMER